MKESGYGYVYVQTIDSKRNGLILAHTLSRRLDADQCFKKRRPKIVIDQSYNKRFNIFRSSRVDSLQRHIV